VAAGLSEGEKNITTGAAALREGDRIVLPGQSPQNAGGGRGGRRGGGSGEGGGQRGAPGGAAPQQPAPEGAPIRPRTGD
jgi:hypothetical protein